MYITPAGSADTITKYNTPFNLELYLPVSNYNYKLQVEDNYSFSYEKLRTNVGHKMSVTM